MRTERTWGTGRLARGAACPPGDHACRHPHCAKRPQPTHSQPRRRTRSVGTPRHARHACLVASLRLLHPSLCLHLQVELLDTAAAGGSTGASKVGLNPKTQTLTLTLALALALALA